MDFSSIIRGGGDDVVRGVVRGVTTGSRSAARNSADDFARQLIRAGDDGAEAAVTRAVADDLDTARQAAVAKPAEAAATPMRQPLDDAVRGWEGRTARVADDVRSPRAVDHPAPDRDVPALTDDAGRSFAADPTKPGRFMVPDEAGRFGTLDENLAVYGDDVTLRAPAATHHLEADELDTALWLKNLELTPEGMVRYHHAGPHAVLDDPARYLLDGDFADLAT